MDLLSNVGKYTKIILSFLQFSGTYIIVGLSVYPFITEPRGLTLVPRLVINSAKTISSDRNRNRNYAVYDLAHKSRFASGCAKNCLVVIYFLGMMDAHSYC